MTSIPTSEQEQEQEQEQVVLYDDEEIDNPNIVENLLSKELLNLSFQQRCDYQEEIHGVRSLAREETPQLIEESLRQLKEQLNNDQLIHPNDKRAYIRSQRENNENKNESTSTSTHSTATTTNSCCSCCYINENEFRLRFLRYELFDVKKAAIRMVKWLNLVVDVFGLYALKRPIQLSDFTRSETKYFHLGRFQAWEHRDRGIGRRIATLFPDQEWENIPPRVRHKIIMYSSFVDGYDVQNQRDGAVMIVWFDPTFTNISNPRSLIPGAKVQALLSITRVSALHLCTPDTPFYRTRRSIMLMRLAHIRSNVQIHVGTPIELQYILKGFGIPIENNPITYSGTIKNRTYLSQWMRVRKLIENEVVHNYNPYKSTRIECPYTNDILFRLGVATLTSYNAGNVRLRNLTESKALKYDCLVGTNTNFSSNSDSKSDSGNGNGSSSIKSNSTIQPRPPPPRPPPTSKMIAIEIVKELKQQQQRRTTLNDDTNNTTSNNNNCMPSRFLVWNNSGWWEQIHDEEEILHKVNYVVGEYRYNAKKKMKMKMNTNKKNGNKKMKIANQQHQDQQQQPSISTNTDRYNDGGSTSGNEDNGYFFQSRQGNSNDCCWNRQSPS